MLRGLLDSIILFGLPFAAYALYLALRRRFAAAFGGWDRGPVLRLVIAGLALAVAGTLLGGVFARRHTGAYIPAHIDHGVLIPGRIE